MPAHRYFRLSTEFPFKPSNSEIGPFPTRNQTRIPEQFFFPKSPISPSLYVVRSDFFECERGPDGWRLAWTIEWRCMQVMRLHSCIITSGHGIDGITTQEERAEQARAGSGLQGAAGLRVACGSSLSRTHRCRPTSHTISVTRPVAQMLALVVLGLLQPPDCVSTLRFTQVSTLRVIVSRLAARQERVSAKCAGTLDCAGLLKECEWRRPSLA